MIAPKPGWTPTAAYYGFLFCAIGAHLPFWPLWLADWGLTEAEVGAYISASIVARVGLGVAIPWAADQAGAPRRALGLLAVLGGAIFALHAIVETRAALFIVTLASAAIFAGALPIVDALSLRAADRGNFAYAPARSVGSAAFLFANLACGAAVAAFGSGAALWWIVVCTLPLIWLGLRHPGGAGAPLPRPSLGDARRLLASRPFLLTMLAGSTLQGSHAVLYTYGSIHWRSQGIGDDVIGALWAWGVLLEVLLMAFAGKWLVDRLGAAGALALAGAAGVLRWALMTLDPSLLWLWPLQAMHAITFTASFLGALALVREIAPDSLGATAQGLVGATAGGVVMAGAGFAAAWVYPLVGGGAYWIGAGLSLLGLIAALQLRRSGQSGASSKVTPSG